MINTITGELKIFTKEGKGKKSITIFTACVGSTKENDGKFTNYYMLVNFSKALKDKIASTGVYKNKSFDLVNIEAWIKAYKDNEGNVKPILFINKCDLVTDAQKKKSTVKTDDNSYPF